MSTHNIGFYEDLTKIIFELSSNITKYAPYFFCCKLLLTCFENYFWMPFSLKYLAKSICRIFSCMHIEYEINSEVFKFVFNLIWKRELKMSFFHSVDL